MEQQAAEVTLSLVLALPQAKKSRWERYDVLGEIKPECMPDWAKEALAKIKEQQKEKKQKNREER